MEYSVFCHSLKALAVRCVKYRIEINTKKMNELTSVLDYRLEEDPDFDYELPIHWYHYEDLDKKDLET